MLKLVTVYLIPQTTPERLQCELHTSNMDTLHKGLRMSQEGTAQDNMRLHHTAQNNMQFKTGGSL